MTTTDLPFTHFRILVEEISNRYKVCLSLSNFLDEISETGVLLGKSLIKIGSSQFITNNAHQWLPIWTSICESVYKMNTISNSKQVSRFCNSISHNISKLIPENIKIYRKKLQTLSSKVIAQVEEFKRLVHIYQKSNEKYVKMVQDTETAIKNRYIALETETKEANERITIPGKDDSFVNRSLNKMLSKITPNSTRLDERCKLLLKELDIHEKSLVSNCKRLQSLRLELVNDVNKTTKDIEEMESQRITMVIESLSKYCLSADQCIQQNAEMNAEVSLQTIRFNSDEEALKLIDEVDHMTNKTFLVTSMMENDVLKLNAVDVYEMFSKADKLSEAMEYFKSLLVKLASSLFEVAECESVYARSIQKVLERHGYSKMPSSPQKSPTTTSTVMSISGKDIHKSGDLLSLYEAPCVKNGWEAIITSVSNGSDISIRTAEVFCEEVCQQLDLVQQRLEIGRKELIERLTHYHKLVENARLNDQKLKLKLEKLQTMLMERRNTLKLAKEKDEQSKTVNSESSNHNHNNKYDNNHNNNGNSDKELNPTVVIQSKGSIESIANREVNPTLEEKSISTESNVISDREVNPTLETQNISIESIANSDKQLNPVVETIATIETIAVEDCEVLNNSIEEVIASPDLQIESSSETNPEINNLTITEVIPGNSPTIVSSSSASIPQMKRKSLIESKLKQVVGLEKSYDRIIRIEKQINTLEEEENELIINSSIASQVLVSASNLAMVEIFQIFNTTKDVISSDLATIKKAITSLMFWKNESLDSKRDFNKSSHQALEAIDIAQCLDSLRLNVNHTFQEHFPNYSNGNMTITSPLFLEIVEIEVFIPIDNETITQERSLIVQHQQQLTQQQQKVIDNNNDVVLVDKDSNHVDSIAFDVVETNIDNKNNISPTIQTPALTTIEVPNELARFGLSNQDKLLESYSCALYPNKTILSHGRLFITQHYLAFSGWPEARVLLAISNIETITREKTLYYVPNAISIIMSDQSEYFFASFIEREQCFNMINNLSQVAKRVREVSGVDSTQSSRKLELGYQVRSNIFGATPSMTTTISNGDSGKINSSNNSPTRSRGSSVSNKEIQTPPLKTIDVRVTKSDKSLEKSPNYLPLSNSSCPNNTDTISSAIDSKSSPNRNLKSDNIPLENAPIKNQVSQGSPSSSTVVNPDSNPQLQSTNTITATTSSIPLILVDTLFNKQQSQEEQRVPELLFPQNQPSITLKGDAGIVKTATKVNDINLNTSEPIKAVKDKSKDDVEVKVIKESISLPYIDFKSLFQKSNITILQSKEFDINAFAIWKSCWFNAVNYRDFLMYLGEIEVVYSEWIPIDSKVKLPAEDVMKLSFTHTRQINFLHVRTTMLMFGPKNAPSNQTQYLYLPNNTTNNLIDIDLNTIHPTSGLILTITYFEGIPMCDVFKVCHYSSFEPHRTNPEYTIVNIGLVVHFLKNSMFKYQIQSGTKEEVIEQSLKWLTFAKSTSNNFIMNNDISIEEENEEIILSDEENPRLDNIDNDLIPTTTQSRRTSRRLSKRLSISQSVNATNTTNTTNTTSATSSSNNNLNLDNNIVPIKSTNDTNLTNNELINTNSIFNQPKLWLFLGCTFMVISIYLHRQSSTINILSTHIDKLYKEISENKELINLTNKKLEFALKQIEKLILESK